MSQRNNFGGSFDFFCKSLLDLLVCWQVPATLKKDEKSSAGCGSWESESKLQFSTGMLAIDQLLWSTCRFKWATSKTPFFILSKRVTLRTSCKQNYQGTGRLVSKSQGFMHFLDAFIGFHTFFTHVNFVVWSISDIKSKDEPKEQFWWLFRFFANHCWYAGKYQLLLRKMRSLRPAVVAESWNRNCSSAPACWQLTSYCEALAASSEPRPKRPFSF